MEIRLKDLGNCAFCHEQLGLSVIRPDEDDEFIHDHQFCSVNCYKDAFIQIQNLKILTLKQKSIVDSIIKEIKG